MFGDAACTTTQARLFKQGMLAFETLIRSVQEEVPLGRSPRGPPTCLAGNGVPPTPAQPSICYLANPYLRPSRKTNLAYLQRESHSSGGTLIMDSQSPQRRVRQEHHKKCQVLKALQKVTPVFSNQLVWGRRMYNYSGQAFQARHACF